MRITVAKTNFHLMTGIWAKQKILINVTPGGTPTSAIIMSELMNIGSPKRYNGSYTLKCTAGKNGFCLPQT